VKEKIVDSLRKSKDWISGEILASNFGISRSAVWKHIRELRALGYKIDSGRKGYKLIFSPNVPYGFEVKNYLKTKFLGKEFHWFSSLDSTQDVARKFAYRGASEGAVFLAEEQRRGRGRLGRSWVSPSGGLWFSVLLRPSLEPKSIPFLSLLGGLAVVEAISLLQLKSQIKWPNDVLIGGKKLAGVLVEGESELDRVHFVIIGIGINCNNKLPHLPSVTSLKKEVGREVERAFFLAQVLNRLEKNYLSFLSGEKRRLIEEINKHLAFKNENVCIKSGEKIFKGKLRGIGEEGELVILTSRGERYFNSGEILV
jgi:BirA family biotin operon repressor/biotin-[acetyl-CoA-carboxylase] ligase